MVSQLQQYMYPDVGEILIVFKPVGSFWQQKFYKCCHFLNACHVLNATFSSATTIILQHTQ